MKLTEMLVTNVITALKNNFSAKVTALNLEYGDSLLVAPTSTSYFMNEKAIENIANWPAIFVLGDSHIWRDEKQDIAEHKLVLVVGVMEQDEDKLVKILMRTLRAVIEILDANRTLSGSALEIDFEAAEYSPMLRSATDVFVKDVSLALTIWTQEV